MLTHSKIPKFAFIGTSSAGKTTATYQTCAFLKQHGIRVDGILQQDRRLPFSPSLLPVKVEAQHWFIANMMCAESYLSLQEGTDCLVSDRSVIDFFAYAETQWPGQLESTKAFVADWCTTYETLFYLKPRAYDNDGVRPPDAFRLEVDVTLRSLLPERNTIEVSSWEQAAWHIATTTKQLQLGRFARLTGSWFKHTYRVGSDFDFILLPDEWESLPSLVKGQFVQTDHLPSRAKFNDAGLIATYHSETLNIGVQIQQDSSTLKTRLRTNHV